MTEIDVAQSRKEAGLTSVVAESVPHLKRGAIRDFKNIMVQHGYWREQNWNKSDSIYTFETGWQIEFFSVDQPDKLRGGRRDRLFGNECNTWANGLEAFNQLEVRTKESVFLDWNPSNEFWFYTDVLGTRDDIDHIILTYKDNEALSKEIVQSIEARKGNKMWWQVYGLGQLGEIETQIFKNWSIVDTIPDSARLEARGMDFGYSNDPTTIVDVYKFNDGYILDEQLYRKGLSNKQISDIIQNLPMANTTVVADSAEPKSIDEIAAYGVTIFPAQKGPGSINQGIQLVQGIPISVTKRSTNILKEYRNYIWLEDKDGKVTNKPMPGMDHCMDALRYAISFLNPYDERNESDLAIY